MIFLFNWEIKFLRAIRLSTRISLPRLIFRISPALLMRMLRSGISFVTFSYKVMMSSALLTSLCMVGTGWELMFYLLKFVSVSSGDNYCVSERN